MIKLLESRRLSKSKASCWCYFWVKIRTIGETYTTKTAKSEHSRDTGSVPPPIGGPMERFCGHTNWELPYVEEIENIFLYMSFQIVSPAVGYFAREPLVSYAYLLCFLCKSGKSHDRRGLLNLNQSYFSIFYFQTSDNNLTFHIETFVICISIFCF